MLHFLEQDGFTLVTPAPEDAPKILRVIAEGQQMNNAYLAGLPELPKGGMLTGSFIYSHPPDYVGRPTMTWGVNEWRALFRELKEMGIDTVIYQAAAWVEVRECNYPSKVFAGYRTWDSLTPLVEANAKEGMRLFLGGLGNLSAFDVQATPDLLATDRDQQLGCFDELAALYQGGFQGFYMSPETAFPGQRQPEREAMLNRYYSDVCRGVKVRMPNLPILFSPATLYTPDTEQAHHDFLLNLFRGCPLDILSPQDSIGTMGNRLQYLRPSFAIWQQVCQELGCTLWVNVESFEARRTGTAQNFDSADFERLTVQLANACRVGQKIVSWEVPYFYSPLAGERGIQLKKRYLASCAAGERQ